MPLPLLTQCGFLTNIYVSRFLQIRRATGAKSERGDLSPLLSSPPGVSSLSAEGGGGGGVPISRLHFCGVFCAQRPNYCVNKGILWSRPAFLRGFLGVMMVKPAFLWAFPWTWERNPAFLRVFSRVGQRNTLFWAHCGAGGSRLDSFPEKVVLCSWCWWWRLFSPSSSAQKLNLQGKLAQKLPGCMKNPTKMQV